MNVTQNTKTNYGSCIIATHATEVSGPPDALIQYLKERTYWLLVIRFPLSANDKFSPYYEVYKQGCSIEKKAFPISLKPFILNYFRDISLTIFWSFLAKSRYKIHFNSFFGCNNLLTVAGLFVKKVLKVDYLVFYAIDYSDKRFGNQLLNKIYLGLDKFAATKASFVWSNTNRTRAIRKQQGVKDKANLYVPNGVFLESISTTNEKFSIQRKPVLLEYHGTITETKGIQNVMYALEKLKELDFEFHIIGSGDFEQNLKEIAANSSISEKIKFLGRFSNYDTLQLLSNYDLSVALINAKDDYVRYCDPMKVKEALVSNLPVLISSVPEVAEFIQQNNLGIVVEDPENAQEISQKLERILKQPSLIEDFRKNIKNIRFNLDWNQIYGTALGNLIVETGESFVLVS